MSLKKTSQVGRFQVGAAQVGSADSGTSSATVLRKSLQPLGTKLGTKQVRND